MFAVLKKWYWFWLVANGYQGWIQKILKKDRQYLELKNTEGATALVVAAQYKHGDLVRFLIDQGANVKNADCWRGTALHAAVRLDDPKWHDIVDVLLLKGADVDAVEKEGATPIFYAIGRRNIVVVEKLLAANASLSIVLKKRGTLLHLIALCAQKNDLVWLNLIERVVAQGVAVDALDAYNNTALFYAIKQGLLAIAERLIAADPAVVNRQGPDGKTPLHWAVANSKKDLVALLIARGASVNIKDCDGSSPLHLAVSANVGVAIVHQLLNAGAEVAAQDDWHGTPLSLAQDKQIKAILEEHFLTCKLKRIVEEMIFSRAEVFLNNTAEDVPPTYSATVASGILENRYSGNRKQ